MSPTVFLDRDGTLVRDYRHGADPALLRLLPGVAPALRALVAAGYRLVVVTNQSGVARGLFSLGEARIMGRQLGALVAACGVRLAGYYLCPHYPEEDPGPSGSRASHPSFSSPEEGEGQQGMRPPPGYRCHCACRKPAPGLLWRAARDLGLDLASSWMVGDSLSDVGAGKAAGTGAILIDIGKLSLTDRSLSPPGGRTLADALVARNLAEALAAHNLADALVARNLPHAAALILAAGGHLAAEVEPADPATLFRRPPSPSRRPRPTGAASPWPSAEWLALAARDGEWLAEQARLAGLEVPAT